MHVHPGPRVWQVVLVLPILLAGSVEVSAVALRHQEIVPESAIAVDAAGRVTVALDGFDRLAEPGHPALPYRIVRFVLPPGDEVAEFHFVETDHRVVRRSFNPTASLPLVSINGTVGKPPGLAYRSDGGVFPSVAGRYLGTGYLHGHAIASFAVFPFRVVGSDLGVANVGVEVSTRPRNASSRVVSRKRFRAQVDSDERRQVASLLVNPADILGGTNPIVKTKKETRGFAPTLYPTLDGSAVDYLIITNDSLVTAYEVLAEWKTARGVPTVIRTTEWIKANTPNGVDIQETLRNFIIEAYQYWGIKWVLLGGDTGQISARFGATAYGGDKNIPVDMYFGCLDGDWNADHDALFGEPGPSADAPDLYQEVWVGRLPSNNVVQAQDMINKIVSYETPTNRDYMSKILLLSEVLSPIDWTFGETINIDGAALSETLELISLSNPSLIKSKKYENYYDYPGSEQELIQCSIDSLNAGFNYVNHIGHGFRFNISVGNGSLLNADADALTNTDRYFNIFMVNCTAAAFNYFCLAEHFLLNPVGGAVTVIGANESAFPITAQAYMNQYYYLVLEQGVTNIGEAFARSRLPKTPIAEMSDNAELWMHYIYTFLGDPELTLWTGPIDTMTVTHVDSVGFGTSSITVGVSDSGGPLQGATVCLSKGLDDYGVGTTNTAGNVTFAFASKSPGAIRVMVTAQDRVTYDGEIQVTGSSSWVRYEGITIEDDSTSGTSGNGDGVIDSGEIVDFYIDVRNSGATTTGNITLALRSQHGDAVVIDSTATVGVIASDAVAQTLDPFRVSFSSVFGDESTVTFTVAVLEDSVEIWRDTFTKKIGAPNIVFVVTRIDDSVLGNGDGIIQDNEDFRLFYKIKNFGTGTAYGVTVTLSDLDAGFVLVENTDVYPDIPSMAESENSVGFHIREINTAVESDLRLRVYDAYGRQTTVDFELRVPTPPTNVTVDPSLGLDRLLVSWDPSVAPDVDQYNVYQSFTSGGPYTLSNTDQLNHTQFMSEGLLPTSRYYYVVTAIDFSGNESAISNEFAGSTNPAQVVGWPIQMISETVSSPVIGDIDGDQDFEIVVGNLNIYAWHHDGVELLDKDNNAQTWGQLTTVGSNFVSHIALAPMDSIPGSEILAASRDTKEVYVFDYKGDPLPGWPRPVENVIRAGMVAADINNDGIREVIAIDELGVLYVWNPDGSEYRDGDSDPGTDGVFRRFPGCTYQYSTPTVADLDGDGSGEIIVGTQGDSVYVLNEDGSSVPGWPFALTSDISGSIAAGDVDGDGDLEIVINELGGLVWALHHDATTLWTAWFPNSLAFGPSPALSDLTGDGKLEALIPSANMNLYAIRYDGTNAPGWPVSYSTTIKTESSPVIADIDNDGSLDVVLGDESKFINGWDANGVPLAGFPLAMEDAVRSTPTIADLDKDGDVDLIAAGWDKFVYVWDFPSMFNPLLATWASFHGNLFNDGNIETELPTGIDGVMFWFDVRSRGVELVWEVPAYGGYRFDVLRAEASLLDGNADSFGRIASSVTADFDGVVRFIDRNAEMGTGYVYRLQTSDDGEQAHQTSVVYVPVTRASLRQNFPNPFNPSTQIVYFVPDGVKGRVSLVVYDVRGARVRTLFDGPGRGGKHMVQWDGRNDTGSQVSTGVYFYRLVQPGFTETRKMVLLK